MPKLGIRPKPEPEPERRPKFKFKLGLELNRPGSIADPMRGRDAKLCPAPKQDPPPARGPGRGHGRSPKRGPEIRPERNPNPTLKPSLASGPGLKLKFRPRSGRSGNPGPR